VNSFRRPAFLACLFIGLLYLVVIVPAPGISLPAGVHDDGLFMRWSVSILNGHWLGPWDHLTTAKGPLHSLLTAAAANLGINPFVYKRIFYLAGSLVFIATGLGQSPVWLKVLTLITLLCDPFQYGIFGLRNLREGTYIPLQLVAFGLGSWSLDQLREKNRFRASLVAAIVGTAICFGLILITREARMVAWFELAIWLLIGVFLVAWSIRHQHSRRLGVKALAILLSVVLIIGMTSIPSIGLSSLNGLLYKFSISNSFEEGAFPVLYGKLLSTSVKGQALIPRVHVKKSTLNVLINEADKGSPLSKILQGIPSGWEKHGCKFYPQTCGEIAGGWFAWALRDGIASSLEPGASELSFQKTAQYANSELDSICKQTKILQCGPQNVGYMPSLSRWGFRSPIQEIAKEGKKITSLALIPSIYPQGKVNLAYSEPDPLNLEVPLGIKHVNLAESSKWERIFGVASFLGAAGKWTLILVSISFAFLASMRLRVSKLFDPVALWMFFSVILHLAAYTLLGLTSFPGDTYVIMASPLFIGLLARLSAFLLPLINGNRQNYQLLKSSFVLRRLPR